MFPEVSVPEAFMSRFLPPQVLSEILLCDSIDCSIFCDC
jgi:hypothetical protein